MWLAHLLTVSRLPLAIVFWMVAGQRDLALGVLVAAAATDVADGNVARWAKRRGATGRFAEIGKWLDPVCDKAFAVIVLAGLWTHHGAPAYELVLIGAREIVLVPLALVYLLSPLRRKYAVNFQAATAGKLATIAQFAAVTAIVAGMPNSVILAAIAAAVGLFAAWRYVAAGRATTKIQVLPATR